MTRSNPLQIIALVVALALVMPSEAQVYKCTQNGRTVYSGTPCSSDASPVVVRPATGLPDPEEAQRALDRAQRDKQRVQTIEAERQLQREIVDARREQAVQAVQADKQRKADKCETVRRDLAHEQKWSEQFVMEENRARARENARKLQDREFFDCR